MKKKIDLTNQKFGKLFVIKRIESNKDYRDRWLCKCDCGNEKIILGQNIRRGYTVSCGCYSLVACCKGVGELNHTYWGRLQADAKRRNLKFDLSIEYAWNLFLQQDKKCALTGEEIYFSKSSKDLAIGNITASLDRINSQKGYEIDNVQWVHKTVNKIKQNLNEKEFIDWCKKVVNYAEQNKIINQKKINPTS